MKSLFLSLLAALSIVFPALAQEDFEGSKDHPMFTRLPNFYIEEYASNFDAVDMPIGPGKNKAVEGQHTFIRYAFKEESGQQLPSVLQIERNYQNAITKIGGKQIAKTEEGTTMMVTRDGKEVWVKLEGYYSPQGGGISNYSLHVVEVQAMKQDITASDILDALNKEGFIALQINFDTGKSTIKAESQPIVEQIAAMLKQNPSLKVSIEGHTDNVGQPAANKTLSEQRAKAVVAALTAKGIVASRLNSAGWGSEKPVADNRTEDGRAKNRRVEIVKK